MEYPFYLEQKFYDAGRLETRTLTAQEAEEYARVPVIASGEAVYAQQGYVVLHYDSVEALWRAVEVMP